jgi:hypothetical protein
MTIRFSLSNLAVGVGSVLALLGLWAYTTGNATLNLAGFFYGIPLLLIGLALKAAELQPVPYSQPPSAQAEALREQQATPTQLQIRKDVRRHRYGQYVHLEPALKALNLILSNDERPALVGMREEAREGCYALVLEFDSPTVAFSKWQDKQDKMTRFFGPRVAVDLSQPQEGRVELVIIAQPEVTQPEVTQPEVA